MTLGKVYLVGAGPGDPGLISVKGLECLRHADVVIYDHLLDNQLLDFASAEAERLYVGKAAKQHVKEQDEVNQLMVEKAREGKRVVRLKGGDPFVLGRGGEEAEMLSDNHIPFEVVPGISSAVAVPAYAGIPVTHRGLASSFVVITGHEDPSKDSSSIAWEKLATGVDTLVFLMGMANLPEIIEQLLKYGRSLATPVAVIKNGTRPEQKTIVGTVADIVGKVKEQHFTAPAVVVVGEVVRLREKIRWFDNRPLFGKRILVTRARHQASELSRLLVERGARPVELPVIEIQTGANKEVLGSAILNLERYHWIVFTSVNGVEAFFQRLHELNRDSRALTNLKIAAIGPATAQSLKKQGIIPDFVPEVYTTEGLIDGFRRREIAGLRFLLARADIADEKLTVGLSQLGAEVEAVASYRTLPTTELSSRAKQLLSADQIDVITFTSSSTVSNLLAALGGSWSMDNTAKIACIGPKTADTAIKNGLRVDIIASEHSLPGLVRALEHYFDKGALDGNFPPVALAPSTTD